MTLDEAIEPAAWYVYLLRRITPQCINLDTGELTPVLKCTGSGNRLYYVGMTNTLTNRLARHNAGEVPSTRGQQWELMAYAKCATRKEAALLERWLKNGDSRKKRENFIRQLGYATTCRDAESLQYIRVAQYWSAKQLLTRNFNVAQRKASTDAI
jgi:predicted GIY-YIG superfamily endonuclease